MARRQSDFKLLLAQLALAQHWLASPYSVVGLDGGVDLVFFRLAAIGQNCDHGRNSDPPITAVEIGLRVPAFKRLARSLGGIHFILLNWHFIPSGNEALWIGFQWGEIELAIVRLGGIPSQTLVIGTSTTGR